MWEQKHKAPGTYYYVNNDYAMLKSLHRIRHRTGRKQKAQKDQNSFPKESVENADLSKPALNKIMTTHE